MDYNLSDNCVRYIFADSPVLSVGIFEDDKHVIILITTVCSLHRLNFIHPDYNNRDINDVKPVSVFVNAHEKNPNNLIHIFAQPSSARKFEIISINYEINNNFYLIKIILYHIPLIVGIQLIQMKPCLQ